MRAKTYKFNCKHYAYNFIIYPEAQEPLYSFKRNPNPGSCLDEEGGEEKKKKNYVVPVKLLWRSATWWTSSYVDGKSHQ